MKMIKLKDLGIGRPFLFAEEGPLSRQKTVVGVFGEKCLVAEKREGVYTEIIGEYDVDLEVVDISVYEIFTAVRSGYIFNDAPESVETWGDVSTWLDAGKCLFGVMVGESYRVFTSEWGIAMIKSSILEGLVESGQLRKDGEINLKK